MNDTVVDSSVIAKWILPESDSALAHQVLLDVTAKGGRLLALDIAVVEVANAIWKRHYMGLATLDEARQFLAELERSPIHVQPAASFLKPALEIAAQHKRAMYDALFVALSHGLSVPGVTADEPLYNVVHTDFTQIILLRHW